MEQQELEQNSKRLAEIITQLYESGFKDKAWDLYRKATAQSRFDENIGVEEAGEYIDAGEREEGMESLHELESELIPRVIDLGTWAAINLMITIDEGEDTPMFEDLWDNVQDVGGSGLHADAQRLTDVGPDDEPSREHVWFKEGPGGEAEIYKINSDNSQLTGRFQHYIR
jgi:hypothetical protein